MPAKTSLFPVREEAESSVGMRSLHGLQLGTDVQTKSTKVLNPLQPLPQSSNPALSKRAVSTTKNFIELNKIRVRSQDQRPRRADMTF